MQRRNLIKILLLSIFLLSMSALVSAQENVLLETWGQKLDLTIPSSEMQSTSCRLGKSQTRNYDGVDLLLSERTYQCCPNRAFVKLTESMLRESQRKSQFTLVDSYTNAQLYTFATLQLLDIWTTYKSLQYDCVQRTKSYNGRITVSSKNVCSKNFSSHASIEADIKNERLTRKTMRQVNTMMVMVITTTIQLEIVQKIIVKNTLDILYFDHI